MRLGPHRRNLVLWSSAGYPASTRPPRVRRVHRLTRTGTALTVISLRSLAHVIRPRWQPLLAGAGCTVAGLILHSGAWGAILLPGLLLLVYSVFVSAYPEEARQRLEQELAAYSTRAERGDLEAILDQYPDAVTRELRDILTRPSCARN